MKFRYKFFAISTSFLLLATLSKGQTVATTPGKLVLDRQLLMVPCSDDRSPCGNEPSKSFLISVRSEIDNPPNDIEYRYEVTGGFLINPGKEVGWNLENLQPGTYRITMTPYSNLRPIGQSLQAEVRVESVVCICDCSCPRIEASGPKQAKNGEVVNFVASISGAGDGVTQNWVVENGEIISGQGTPAIQVRVKRSGFDKFVRARVEFSGFDPSCNCISQASADTIIVD